MILVAFFLAHCVLWFWLGWRWRYITALRCAERSTLAGMRELASLARQREAGHG